MQHLTFQAIFALVLMTYVIQRKLYECNFPA